MTKVEGLLQFYVQNGGIHCVNDSMSLSATLSLSVTNVYVEVELMEFHLISCLLDYYVPASSFRGQKQAKKGLLSVVHYGCQ